VQFLHFQSSHWSLLFQNEHHAETVCLFDSVWMCACICLDVFLGAGLASDFFLEINKESYIGSMWVYASMCVTHSLHTPVTHSLHTPTLLTCEDYLHVKIKAIFTCK